MFLVLMFAFKTVLERHRREGGKRRERGERDPVSLVVGGILDWEVKAVGRRWVVLLLDRGMLEFRRSWNMRYEGLDTQRRREYLGLGKGFLGEFYRV